MAKNPHAVALGRLGGKVGGKSTSDAKAEAARENGKKGGRPRTSFLSKWEKVIKETGRPRKQKKKEKA